MGQNNLGPCAVDHPSQGPELPLPGSSQFGVKRRRKAKKCGICGVIGHTRRKCQDPRRFD